MKKFKWFLFCFFVISHAFSQVNYVSQLNDPIFYGGKIKVMAKNSTCVLVGTEGGIFKSTDYGLNWTNGTKYFDQNTVNCREIVSLGEVFYARTNPQNNAPSIYKSINNGESWDQISVPGTSWTQTIGAMSNTLYAVCGNYSMTEGNYGKLYASTDGISWTPKATVWSGDWLGGDCELYTFNQNKLYLKLQDNMYYTLDGNSLIAISVTGLNANNFSNVEEIDGDVYGNIFCRSNNAIFKYDFTSQTWNNISSGKIPNNNQILELSVTDNAIFFNTLNQNFIMKLYKSVDQGLTFTEMPIAANIIPSFGNIQETSTNTFIAHGLYDDIYFTNDGGITWTSNPGQFIATFSGDLVKSGNSLFFSRDNIGVVSSINGVNWTTSNDGIPGFGGVAYFVSELVQVRDTLFSLVSPDPFSGTISPYRSTDNGVSWAPFNIPAPYNNGEEFHIAGKCDSLLFINYWNSSISKFELISMSIKTGSCVKPGPSSNFPIYVKGTNNFLFGFYEQNEWEYFDNVYKANNLGMSYTNITYSDPYYSIKIKRTHRNSYQFSSPMMDIDYSNNKALFVIQDRSNSNSDKFYKYDLKTSSWSELNTGGLPLNYVGNCLKFTSNNEWFLATNFGLYRSTDGGISWAVTHTSGYWQNGIIVNSIVKMNDKVFLGTIANGVWEVDLSTGMINPKTDNDLRIYPNPASSNVLITVPEWDEKISSLNVYDMGGKLMHHESVKSIPTTIQVNKWIPGNYIIELNTGRKILYQKLIVK